MDWIDWIGLPPEAFTEKLNRRLSKSLSYNALIALYNALMERAGDEPTRIAILAGSIADLFKCRKSRREALLFLELRARSHFLDLEPDRGFAALEEMVETDPEGAEQVVLELARGVHDDLDRFGRSIDERPRLLAAVISILGRYEKLEEMAEIHLEAAMLYSRHNATQAAYRCVQDAEVIAHDIRSLPLLALTYKTMAAVGVEENDYAWSAKVAKKSVKTYQLAGLEPPADLQSNLGVALMNLHQLKPAIRYFKTALKRMPKYSTQQAAVRINLAACLRRLGDLGGAATELAHAETELVEEAGPAHTIELAFGKAKIAELLGNTPDLVRSLKSVARSIDFMLAEVLRLHHRRGIRERYIERLEGLLRHLPDKGTTEDVLLPLVASRGNALGDWLAILEWAEQVHSAPTVSPPLAKDLAAALDSLRKFGAPHLFGFREKYDDPWSPGNLGGLWDTLSQVGGKLVDIGMPRPLDAASSSRLAELCRARLAANHCLMAMTHTGETALLWYFIGDRYGRCAISHEVMASWRIAQLKYAAGELSRNDFTKAIDRLTAVVGPILDPVFNECAIAQCVSVRFVQDFLSDLPLTLLALRNATLSKLMEAGRFEVRVVPALHGMLPSEPARLRSVAAILDPGEDLLLAPSEGTALASAAGMSEPRLIKADQGDDLQQLLIGCDTLIVSTHGHSLEFFTDAYFAQLGSPGRPHPIRVETLQQIAPDLTVKLVILNTCYSGSTSARNFQHRFRTNDAVAIPNLFLLNRQAVVVAGKWKVSDTASFVFASIIGSGLACGMEPSAALARAIARLCRLSRAAALEILETNLAPATFEQISGRLMSWPEVGTFSHPYFAGGLMIYGLL